MIVMPVQIKLSGRALLPPGVGDRVVVVRDDEPTSIVAFFLSSRYALCCQSTVENVAFSCLAAASSDCNCFGGCVCLHLQAMNFSAALQLFHIPSDARATLDLSAHMLSRDLLLLPPSTVCPRHRPVDQYDSQLAGMVPQARQNIKI